jgi:hypothetical protein
MSSTLSLSSNTMSPFADNPDLWLTGHLQRQIQDENARKIQALIRGFLYRRRCERKNAESLGDFICALKDKLQSPKSSVTVAEFLRKHGLSTWADMCPSKYDCLSDSNLNSKRKECLFHAKVSLRLLGKSHLVPDLEWCDYHEARRALEKFRGINQPESLWTTLIKLVLG